MSHMVYRLSVEATLEPVEPDYFIKADQPIESGEGSESHNAKLFWKKIGSREPHWQGKLRDIFPGAPVFNIELPAAVVITRVPTVNGEVWFAICFGQGHHLLDDAKIVRRWGLKVALNLICAGVNDTEYLRRVDARTIRENSLMVARQTSRPDAIESFGVNTQTDVLRAIAGQPVDFETWGLTVYGQDGIRVPIENSLVRMHARLAILEEVHEKTDYKNRFGWVDHVFPIRDVTLVTALSQVLIQNLRSKQIDTLALNAPEFTDWGNSEFKIKGTYARKPDSNPTLLGYLDALESRVGPGNTNALKTLDYATLRRHQLINATTGEKWPMYQCIEGEIVHAGRIYHFSEGAFYEIEDNFINEVDNYLDANIGPSARVFKDNNAGSREDDYIVQVANANSDLLPMDKQLIRGFPVNTSQMELCDLLSDKCEFIHVKREIRSSLLSHLFSQARNSVVYFLRSNAFLDLAIRKVEEVESHQGARASTIWSDSLKASRPNDLGIHVVIGVTGDWKGKDFVERLPFFSRLSLRLAIQDLDGFNVSFEYIQINEV